jgi:hypothetical protein
MLLRALLLLLLLLLLLRLGEQMSLANWARPQEWARG